MNYKAIIQKLKLEQSQIRFESEDDEGAAEWYGDLQSVIDALESGKPETEVREAANWVGVTL